MGVTRVSEMRSAFPKSGTRISVARTALCNAIEMASARRRTRRSPRSCSASPSTRHPRREPNPSSRRFSEAFLSSDDITHLHIFLCERPALHGLFGTDLRKFCGADFLGVARVLTALDTKCTHKFPWNPGRTLFTAKEN